MSYEIEDSKVLVVAGVGPGLGASVCRRFAREGYAVAMLSRRAQHGELAEELKGLGAPKTLAVACDVSDEASVKAAFNEVREKLGEVSCLVYNASGFSRGGIMDLKIDEFENAFRVSCSGALLTMQQVLPSMADKGRGSVLITGATASTRGSARFGGFATGKMGLRALAQSAAREYHPRGVHVAHIVVDGMIREPRTREKFPDMPADRMIQPDSIASLYFTLHKQDPSCFSFETEVRPSGEKW